MRNRVRLAVVAACGVVLVGVAIVLVAHAGGTPGDQAAGPIGPNQPSATTTTPLRRVLVVGDSDALTLGLGLVRWGAPRNIEVVNRSVLGCELLYGAQVRGYWGVETRGDDPCRTHQMWTSDLAEVHPDVVVVLFGGRDVFDASWDGGRTWFAPGDPEWDSRYAASVVGAARLLTSTGARVVWLAPPCFSTSPDAPDAGAVWYSPERVAALGRVEQGVAARAGMFVSEVVHRTGCPVDWRDRPDGVHYDAAGADRIAALVGPELARARS